MQDEFGNEEPEGVKSLRQAHDKAQKRIDELEAALSESAKRDRKRTIADKVKDYNLDPRIANLVPSEIEAEKVDEWLGGYADIFGLKLDQANPADTAEEQAQQRISNLGNNTVPDADPDLTAVRNANSFEEMQELINNAVIGNR